MARLGRYFLPDQPLHVIQRGNNRQAIFFGDVDYAQFRTFLAEAADAYGCAIHAYVLMTNHIHLLITPNRETSVPRMMQSLGRRYVRKVNDVYQRTGTLWEGRYRAAPIDTESYFLACCRSSAGKLRRWKTCTLSGLQTERKLRKERHSLRGA